MIPLYSKSSVQVDNKCRRSYFLAYEALGHGIKTNSTGLEFHLGTALHDGLALIALRQQVGEDINIDEIASTAYSQVTDPLVGDGSDIDAVTFAKEQGTLVEGLLRGFHYYVWPRLMAHHTVKAVELPALYRLNGKAMMTKGDLILEDVGGGLTYLEYKSSSSKKEEWIKSWKTSIQLHTTVAALLQQHGLAIDAIIVQGLYKGFVNSGKQTSIFCYGYRKAANPPFTREVISYDWKPGSRKVPVWDMDGGIKRWVESMPEPLLADQFPQTPLIFPDSELSDAFFRQQDWRQTEIKMARTELEREHLPREQILDQFFPQNFDSCVPAWGRECPYVPICHEGCSTEDPRYAKRSLEHLKPFTDLLTDDEKNG